MVRKLGVLILVFCLVQVPPARAIGTRAVKGAIDRGVRALQAMQGENGTWPDMEVGATALAAVTLLECGVPPNDPSLVKATLALRRASTNTSRTYSLSLLILYFDRLGDANDVALIESLTVRLLGGQQADGGWSYGCPAPAEGEVRRLTASATQERVLVAKRDKEARRRTAEDLPREIRAQLQRLGGGGAPQGPGAAPGIPTDSSNTQFATLALWIARRHGLPVEKALAAIERHFRADQQSDGGWSYQAHPNRSTASMTCAGLLGLAVANGAAIEAAKDKEERARAAKQDRALQDGLLALGSVVGNPTGDLRRAPGIGGNSFYFLWSLERVAMALGVDTVGKKDWYGWGAEVLLANQQPNGCWIGSYGPSGADTCFALLFLKRANFAEDLTAQLRGAIGDPGRVLRGQGVREASGRMGPALDPRGSKGPPSGADRAAEPPAVKLTGLAAELSGADAEQQEVLLGRYRDGKGVKYTEQLASACAQLQGELRQKARKALSERLTRMKAETLAGYLEDEDVEIRRAAALAAAMKDARSLTPRLIGLLDDAQPAVARAAHVALKSLSGKDFGPAAGADAQERHKAIEAWRDWWRQQRKE